MTLLQTLTSVSAALQDVIAKTALVTTALTGLATFLAANL